MEIRVEIRGESADVLAKGRLDAYWSAYLKKELEEVLRQGAHHVRIDLSEAVYISSAGIGVLMNFYSRLREIHGSIVVTNPSPLVKQILDMAKLGELLMPAGETKAAAVVEPERVRHLSRPSVRFEVFDTQPGAAMTCRLVGDPAVLGAGRLAGQACRSMPVPAGRLAAGLGAFGRNFDDCRHRFGEFLAVAGAAACQPTDGSGSADYQLSAGDFVPEVQVLYSLVCEGEFGQLARFEAQGESGTVTLSELASACLEIAEAESAGVAILGESAGLVGAALKQSPAQADPGGTLLAYPEIRQWLSFTAERAFPRALVLAAGVAARSPDGPLAAMIRPLAEASGPAGHFHAAVFSYRPHKRGRIDLGPTVHGLFQDAELLGVMHLLGDGREAVGAGQSEFVRGACWIGRIPEVTAEG